MTIELIRAMSSEQRDFPALVVVVVSNSRTHSSSKKSFESGHQNASCVQEAYVPVNHISDEVYAMIAAFEARRSSAAKETAKQDVAKGLSVTGEDNSAVERLCRVQTLASPSEPPTRFKRRPKAIQ